MARTTLPAGFDRGEVTMIHQGDCRVGSTPDLTFSTVLGSCVSACIRDVVAGVGGMNHFLLAEPSAARDRFGASARYGAFAMEQLINMVLGRGTGDKANLSIKVFGGGLISAALTDIGGKNVEFVRDFLANEGYPIDGEDLGGNYARRVLFKPYSGRALVRRLDADTGAAVARQERMIADNRVATHSVADIELF